MKRYINATTHEMKQWMQYVIIMHIDASAANANSICMLKKLSFDFPF